MKEQKIEKSKGITLITLIVTIIMLLIFAGVGIAILTGDNGILSKSKEAKEESEKSKIIEQIKVDMAQKQVDKYGSINEEDLYSVLRKYGTISSDNAILTTNKGNYNLLISDIYSTIIINRWKGKTAVFVGDSITYGTGTESGMRYWEVLKESLNLSSVTGMGIPGSCISTKSDYGTGNTPLINRYTNIPNADLITIFMGTNDYGHETPLGSITDTTDISFYGALNFIVPALIEKHPTSRIVFVTPLHRYGFGTSSTLGTTFTYDYLDNGVGANLEDYVKAIKEVCERYSVPIIDLYSISELDPSDSTIKTSYMPDGLHPNNQGHKIMADIIKKSLELINPVNIEEPEEPDNLDTTESIKVQIGNVYSTEYKNALNRASMIENIYLKSGTSISLKDNSTYKYGIYQQTSSEIMLVNTVLTRWLDNCKLYYQIRWVVWYSFC